MNSLPKKILFGFLLFLLVGFSLYYILKLIEPSSPPQNILISNIADHQATVSWTTQKLTKGTLIISEDGDFPLLPSLSKKIYRDDGERRLKKEGFYHSHHITVDNLVPQKTYYFLIYQGWKKQFQGSFTTGPTLSSITTPSPVYGRVLTADKKAATGVLVYLQAVNEASEPAKIQRSTILSTVTNNDGRWSLDLGNLRTANLKAIFKLMEKTKEEIIVDAGLGKKFKASTTLKQDNPWPDIILNNKK